MAKAQAIATTSTGNDDPFEAVSDFFSSSTWHLIVTLLWVAAIAVWIALAYWVFQDARRRIRQPALVAACTLLGLVPFLGPLVYLFVRPPEFLADARERELEVIALEQRVDGMRCPDCDFPIEARFIACPSCMRKLRDPCVRCQEPLDPMWRICPYCETAVSSTFSSSLGGRVGDMPGLEGPGGPGGGGRSPSRPGPSGGDLGRDRTSPASATGSPGERGRERDRLPDPDPDPLTS